MCKIKYNCILFLFLTSNWRYNSCVHYSVIWEVKISVQLLLPLVTTDSIFYCSLSTVALLHRKHASTGQTVTNALVKKKEKGDSLRMEV
jgi:hypothetical protein